jgi:hypothetical protein
MASTRTSLILMLEDETERLTRFEAVLTRCCCPTKLLHWLTAWEFQSGFGANDEEPALICLDHDLLVDGPDPGDGRDVANFLATQTPNAHVIIHSSNAPAASSMFFTLEEAGWDVEKIAPLGEDWIEAYWFPIARKWIERSGSRLRA